MSEPVTHNRFGVTIDDDDTRHRIAEIIERHIATYVGIGCATAAAGVGDLNDEERGARKMVTEIRHLHLAEPWLPAHAAMKEILDVLTKDEP